MFSVYAYGHTDDDKCVRAHPLLCFVHIYVCMYRHKNVRMCIHKSHFRLFPTSVILTGMQCFCMKLKTHTSSDDGLMCAVNYSLSV